MFTTKDKIELEVARDRITVLDLILFIIFTSPVPIQFILF
jgi:hypothetical protein